MLAFLPSAVFVLMAPLSVSLALWLAFAAAFAVGLRAFGSSRTLRVFDVAGLILFGAMAFYAGFIEQDFGAAQSGLVLGIGLAIPILWSLAVHRPFTIQYRWLRSPIAPETAARAHTLLSALWATTYAIMAGINALGVVLHQLAPGWAEVLGLLVFVAMLTFTWQSGLYIDKRGGDIPLLGRR